jgi:hypothetical protein
MCSLAWVADTYGGTSRRERSRSYADAAALHSGQRHPFRVSPPGAGPNT